MTRQQLWLNLVGCRAFTWLVFCALSCSGNAGGSSQYIYSTATQKHYVQEVTGDIDARPDFIYSSNYPNGRVVTYYAHWCPHCLHFKPKYIEFSNQVHDLSEKLDVVVETFAVSCVPQSKICTDNQIHSYPNIIFYPPKSTNGTKLRAFDLHPEEVFRMSGVSGVAKTVKESSDGAEKIVSAIQQSSRKTDEKHSNTPEKRYFTQRTRTETFHDAHLSFNLAMNTAIFTQPGPLPAKPKTALLEFLVAMKKTIPFDSSMQSVVSDLIDNFETIVTSPRAWNKIMAKHPPPRPVTEWSQASSQHGTGYTAGLWMLFHIMSVGLVQWNHLVKDDAQKIVPATMANILRDYIEHFFLCEECRLNFLADFDACMFDRCNRLVTQIEGSTLQQYIQYPLWLYETHNAINVRLRKERIEQNVEKSGFTNPADVVWPPTSSCPSCWFSRNKDRWDEFEVYEYLQKSYWLEDNDAELLQIVSTGEVGTKSKFSVEYGELLGNDRYKFNASSIVLLNCLVIAAAFAWYRRRQYTLKGVHKKIESDGF
mmetsp:Transcript_13662/g.31869  ORF Transcript_13662/g.31869 Transcript_13662/m.31869 type:complete len:538 (+) Transcript_13662:111-1724(+)